MIEADLHKKVKRLAKSTTFKRVENKLENGTPDVYFFNKKCCGWMENKHIHLGNKYLGNVKVPFRPGQYPWLKEHYQNGGLSLLGIITDWGMFFAVNENICENYSRDDFHNAIKGRPGKLVSPKDLNKFFMNPLLSLL